MRNRQDTDRPSTGHQQGTDRLGVDVATAARHFGISPDAVRGRLHRGTLDGERRRGQWVIYIADSDRPPTGEQQATTGQRQATDSRDYIASLKEQIADLQRQVERRDVLLQDALRKIPDATMPAMIETITGHPTSSPTAPGATEAVSMSPDTLHRPSWLALAWSRVRGRA